MPHYENLSLRNPSALQAIENWSYCGQVNGASPRDIRAPMRTSRSSYHLGQDLRYHLLTARHDPSGHPVRLCVGRSESRTDFPDTDITTFFLTKQITTIDNYLWVTGANSPGVPSLMALPQGVDIPPGPSVLWTDRSATYPYAGFGYPGDMMIRKASTEGALYVAFVGAGAANKGGCFRAATTATAISTGFTEQTNSGTRFAASTLNGFAVSPDGQKQMLSCDQGLYYSGNAGVTWSGASGFTDTVVGHCEIVYTPAFGVNSWVCCNDEIASGRGVWFTTNNGTNWARASLIGTNTQPTSFYFNTIEALDTQGKILVGFQGIAPCKIYYSLNGGTKWSFITSLIPPYYDMDTNPAALLDPPGPVIVINDGNRITLVWPGETGDEGVFVSDAFGPSGLYYPNDPNVWSRP